MEDAENLTTIDSKVNQTIDHGRSNINSRNESAGNNYASVKKFISGTPLKKLK